jgi:hypothetical protein
MISKRTRFSLGVGLAILSAMAPRIAFAAPPNATPAAAHEVQISESARSHFTAGVNLLQDPDGARYEEAYREFKAAYADSPSWKILGNLGLASMKLERDGEAIEAYQKYLAESGNGIEADEREQVKRDLSTLTAGVVRLEATGLPEGASLVDERIPVQGVTVRNQYDGLKGDVKLGIRAGHHRLTVRATGFQEEVWEFDAPPGSTQTHAYALKPVEKTSAVVTEVSAPPGPAASDWNTQKTAAVVAGGVGVVGAALGTVFFFSYKSKNDDAKAVCVDSSQCPAGSSAQHAELVDDARTARTLTYVGWGVGVAGLGTAAVLYFTAPKGERAQSALSRPLFAPAVGPGHVGATLSGAF